MCELACHRPQGAWHSNQPRAAPPAGSVPQKHPTRPSSRMLRLEMHADMQFFQEQISSFCRHRYILLCCWLKWQFEATRHKRLTRCWCCLCSIDKNKQRSISLQDVPKKWRKEWGCYFNLVFKLPNCISANLRVKSQTSLVHWKLLVLAAIMLKSSSKTG